MKRIIIYSALIATVFIGATAGAWLGTHEQYARDLASERISRARDLAAYQRAVARDRETIKEYMVRTGWCEIDLKAAQAQ